MYLCEVQVEDVTVCGAISGGEWSPTVETTVGTETLSTDDILQKSNV
jgi:hypothetical protein